MIFKVDNPDNYEDEYIKFNGRFSYSGHNELDIELRCDGKTSYITLDFNEIQALRTYLLKNFD